MTNCTENELGLLLHAYELELLSEGDEERFELHLMDCEHCFDQVRHFQAERLLLTHDGQVRRQVHAFTRHGSMPAGSALKRLWSHLWPKGPLVFRPALLYVLLLAMIIPAIRGLRPGPETGTEQIRATRAISLFPLRGQEEPVLFSFGAGEGILAVLVPGAVAGAEYRLRIETEEGTPIFDDHRFTGFDREAVGRLILPLTGLEPGRYRLTVTDPRRDPPGNREEYFFHLRAATPPAE